MFRFTWERPDIPPGEGSFTLSFAICGCVASVDHVQTSGGTPQQ